MKTFCLLILVILNLSSAFASTYQCKSKNGHLSFQFNSKQEQVSVQDGGWTVDNERFKGLSIKRQNSSLIITDSQGWVHFQSERSTRNKFMGTLTLATTRNGYQTMVSCKRL